MTILFTGNFVISESSASWRRVQAIKENQYEDFQAHTFLPLRQGTVLDLCKLLFFPRQVTRIYIYNKSFLLNFLIVVYARIFMIPTDFDLVEYGERRRGLFGKLKIFDEYLSVWLPKIHHSNVYTISQAMSELHSTSTFNKIVLPPILMRRDADLIEKIGGQINPKPGKIGILSKNKLEDDLDLFLNITKSLFDKKSIVIIGVEPSDQFDVFCLAPRCYTDYLKEVASCELLILPRANSSANLYSSPTRIAELVLLKRKCILPEGFIRLQKKVVAETLEYFPGSEVSIEEQIRRAKECV